jgi:hypothetical protein
MDMAVSNADLPVGVAGWKAGATRVSNGNIRDN